MSMIFRFFFLLGLVLFGASGCSRGNVDPDQASGLNPQRLVLSEGYSLLYADATNIHRLEWILYVKVESDPFDQLITSISDYGKELKQNLERIAREYPGVRIDLKPLPEMEKRKRFAVGKDRAIRYAPLSGRGGPEYERTMLISLSNALNHEYHLCGVMAAEEPDAGLKKFLLTCQQRYEELHALTLDLLEREYF